MTPLLGTKTPSALVGAKSGGDRRAARSLLSCALWSGMARLWRGMGGRRPPRRQHGLLVFHQPRDTQHGFTLPSGDFKESNLKPDQRVFTNHERRLFSPCMRKGHTVRNHRPDRRARRPVATFLRVVARHGAAMERYGRPPSPAQATRPAGFSPATGYATWYFPCPPATSWRATSSPTNGFFTKHETRNTNHGFFFESRLPYPRFPTISHHFPAFPGPPTPLRCSRSASRRAPSAAAPTALRARSSEADTQ